MWITLVDREREYVINFDNIICFAKLSDCHGSPYLDLVIDSGAIQLFYNSEEERDTVYENLRLKLNAQTKIGS